MNRQIEISEKSLRSSKPESDLACRQEIKQMDKMVKEYLSGKLSEEQFRRFRLQHGIYSIRNQTSVFMARIRVPIGRLTANQLQALARVSRKYASGFGHITTRQDVQIYQVSLESIADMLAELGQDGLTTRETSGNVVRNVTVDPLSGVAKDELFDVRPYAESTMRLFLRNPISQNLGRKFKIAFSSSPADRAYARINDLGAIARIEISNGQPVLGFSIFVGGGLGANPRLGQLLEPFTPADQILPTIEAAVRVFDRLGERKNRSKARLKFLIERIGMDAFRGMVFNERAILPMINPSPYPKIVPEPVIVTQPITGTELCEPESIAVNGEKAAYERWLGANVIRQKQAGNVSVVIYLPGGDITADQLDTLAGITQHYANGEMYTMISQNVLLRSVPENALADLYLRLAESGLGQSGAHTLTDVVSCPGAETCPLAITTSRRLATEISRRLSGLPFPDRSPELSGIDIKVSGCPNACGMHHLAAIGLHGASRRIDGQIVPHYRIYMGGRVTGPETIFGTPVMTLPAWNVPAAIERILLLYRRDRSALEDFFLWFERMGPAAIRKALLEFQTLPDPGVEPRARLDWGVDTAFKLEMGDNECAA